MTKRSKSPGVTSADLRAPGMALGRHTRVKFAVINSTNGTPREAHARQQYYHPCRQSTASARRREQKETKHAFTGRTTTVLPTTTSLYIDRLRQLYDVPIHHSFQGVLTQLRLWPGVEAAGVAGRQNASRAPTRGDAFEIDWVSAFYHFPFASSALLRSYSSTRNSIAAV